MHGTTSPQTIKDACDAFKADAEARDLKEPTLYKYKLLFRQLQAFAEDKGLVFISDVDLEIARAFRASWPNRNVAARKKLEHFRAFLRFCQESDWIRSNSATKLRPSKITSGPTLPFSREEVQKVLDACDQYPDKTNAVRLRASPRRRSNSFARTNRGRQACDSTQRKPGRMFIAPFRPQSYRR